MPGGSANGSAWETGPQGARSFRSVTLRSVTKSFGALRALDGVDFQVEAGSIHALVGENGAGKTTLMRVLYGSLQADSGAVLLDGKEARFRSAADGIRAGIGMVSQHNSIIGELSCLENLLLGAEGGVTVRLRDSERRAEALASKMGFSFDWRRDASGLSPAGAQKLEILKLLWRNARIMILDEPTAMLSPADSGLLFASLKSLVQEGAIVILVTHRLPEVMEHCGAVTVLRGGKLVGEKLVRDTGARELAEMIVGHALEAAAIADAPAAAAPLLSVRDLTVAGDRGNDAVRNVSLEVRSGEIVGIAGVDGSGQRELFRALMGVVRPREGEIDLKGDRITKASPAARIRAGVRLIPEDRHADGVVDDWSLVENAAIGLQRLPPLASGSWVDAAGKARFASAAADRFKTRYTSLRARLSGLSGGNQQRFVAGRALALDPKLILAYQPARGLDIDATRDVYDGLRKACAEGAGALVVSYDLDELLENCHRVVAMNLGRLWEPAPGKERDRAEIGRLMVGAE